MLLGRLHEIERQLNAVASNLPPSTDLYGLARDSRSEDTALLCFPEVTLSDCSRMRRKPTQRQKIALLEQRVSNLERRTSS